MLRGRRKVGIIVFFVLQGRSAFFDEQDEAKRRITIEIVTMKAFAPEKAQSLIEFHCRCVGDFGLESDLHL